MSPEREKLSPLENTGLHMTRKEGTNTLAYPSRGKWQVALPNLPSAKPIAMSPISITFKVRPGKND